MSLVLYIAIVKYAQSRMIRYILVFLQQTMK